MKKNKMQGDEIFNSGTDYSFFTGDAQQFSAFQENE